MWLRLLESQFSSQPLRWGPPLPLLRSPPRLPPPLLPLRLLALCPHRSPLRLRLQDDREAVLVSRVLSQRVNPFQQNFGCAQTYRRLPRRRHPSPLRKPQRPSPAPLCHLCRSHPGTLAGVVAWKRCLCIRSGLSLRNWTGRGFSECPDLSVKRRKTNSVAEQPAVLCFVQSFWPTCTRGKTYQWFYCTEVFNLVATKVEMCEVGAFLCQDFQPPWDPVIAEFKLPDKWTVKWRENRKQRTAYPV